MIQKLTRPPSPALIRAGLNPFFSVRHLHGFDTRGLVDRLESEALLNREQAEALMKSLADVLNESNSDFSARAIQREDFDKILFSNSINFNQLRGDLGLVEKNDFMLLKTEVMRLAADVEKLQLRSAEEFRRVQTTNRLELSMEKSRIREEQNAQAIRMKEADAKIESDLATIKTMLEGFNWDLFKTLFPLFSAAGALAFSYLRFHGMMCWPYIRAVPSDPQNGWTLARRKFNDDIGGGICHGLPKASPLTPALKPGKTTIDYILTATHLGNCTVYLDRGRGQEVIGSDPTCGIHSAPYRSKINITLPNGNYKGVIRWFYQANNYGGELFDSCADVTVSTKGSNSRTQDACSRTPLWWPQLCSSGQTRCTFADGVSPGYQTCRGGNFYPVDCMPGSFCVTQNAKAVCKKMKALNPNGLV
ncbi:UNVERIFIED_CONTAM: hypothetical protein HDU68_007369 [Siphonaria sp. JEL0065]|nr:hypothetical protein HDU68_007369 [Siphonaria sp. JEL0065]